MVGVLRAAVGPRAATCGAWVREGVGGGGGGRLRWGVGVASEYSYCFPPDSCFSNLLY